LEATIPTKAPAAHTPDSETHSRAEHAREAQPAEFVGEPLYAPVAARPSLRPANVKAMQRVQGNQVVSRMIAGSTIQRHPQGAELPNKDDQVAEVTKAPEATRTKKEEKEQKGEGATAGKAFAKAQKLTPGAMSLASAQKILQGQFGGIKDIVPGAVEILADQPACAAKYDEVCMRDGVQRPDGSAWKAGDCAADDLAAGVLTQGFAWGGVVYVNGQTTLVTATAHEMLHNNANGSYRATMGETFNEGTTELLARKALKDAGIKVPSETAYPSQVKLTQKLQDLLGEQTLAKAYFEGADSLIAKYEALKGTDSFAALKPLAEALDMEGAMKAMTTSLKSWWKKE
jgi:hypothetical protein